MPAQLNVIVYLSVQATTTRYLAEWESLILDGFTASEGLHGTANAKSAQP